MADIIKQIGIKQNDGSYLTKDIGVEYTNIEGAPTLPLSTANGGTGNSGGYIRTGKKVGTIIANNATAEGSDNTASGPCSHAEGNKTVASGNCSHAGGYETIAGYEDQTVIGQYNDNKSTTLFEVGNGTSNSARSNAFEVHANGNAVVSGDLSVSGNITGNPTFTEASTRANIASGESIATLFGKIKKWFTDLGTAAFKNIPSSGDASTSEVVLGNDTRLSDARNAADVSAWAKAANKPTYIKSEVGLGDVDNTSDMDKPISTATQAALDEKADELAIIGVVEEIRETVGWVGKNLLPNKGLSATVNGVTFTVNADGSVSTSGQSGSGGCWFQLLNTNDTIALLNSLSSGINYVLSGVPSDAPSGVNVSIWNNGSVARQTSSTPVTFQKPATVSTNTSNVAIGTDSSGIDFNGLTFYPMIRRADIVDATYEPYHKNVFNIINDLGKGPQITTVAQFEALCDAVRTDGIERAFRFAGSSDTSIQGFVTHKGLMYLYGAGTIRQSYDVSINNCTYVIDYTGTPANPYNNRTNHFSWIAIYNNGWQYSPSLCEGAGGMITSTVASSGWTAESYTSPSGTVYAYKKEVSITGMTADSYVDGDISSGTYTNAWCVESAGGKIVIRTATQPSASLTFRLYYQI